MCKECDGKGERINPKDRCKTCNGRKVVKNNKILEVHVDKGEYKHFYTGVRSCKLGDGFRILLSDFPQLSHQRRLIPERMRDHERPMGDA